MIEVWFNERGYYIQSAKGEASYKYDLPENITSDAFALYNFRWMVLNQALVKVEFLYDEEEDRELTLHTDSRLVEEINGDIEPESTFARASLQYLLLVDTTRFKRFDCRKCSANTINSRLDG